MQNKKTLTPPSDQELEKKIKEDFKDHAEKCWLELPKEIKDKAKIVINSILTVETKKRIIEEYKNDQIFWVVPYHSGWGRSLRNFLREEVCTDDKLPSGNWDDYYAQCVEYALDLRIPYTINKE